jgi:acyl-CoA synthetase (NDP forming)
MNDPVGSLLQPRQVAVIGASSQRVTLGNTVLRNFDRWPLQGEVLAVHPTAGAIEGRRAVGSVRALPRGLDVAVVCLPASAVAEVLLDLDAVACRAAVVVAGGFQPDQARRLRDVAAAIDVAVCGPNNMGVINATDSIALYTARFRDPLPVGPVALIAQSGSAAIALLNTPGLAFSKVITSGNEISLASADYLRWLAQDPATTTAGLVLESIRDGDDFAQAANAFAAAGKRLAVLKVGRTPLGSAAANAHTGALVGASAAYSAFFRRLGVAVADDYDELAAMLQCFATEGLPRARGRRLAIVAISGGEGALAADLATEAGLPLATFAEATRAALHAAMPDARVDNPLDLHGSVTRAPDADTGALRAILADPGVDVVLALQDAQRTLPIHDAHDYVRYLETLAQAVAGAEKPVVVASTTSAETHPRLQQVLAGTVVPLLRGIRAAVAACGGLAPGSPTPPPPPPRQPAEALPLDRARSLLATYGIPLVRSEVARDQEAAMHIAHAIGYPVVLKGVARTLLHRTEAGAVALDLRNDAALLAALRAMPSLEAYEIQPYIPDAVEVLVGFTSDPGLGGTVSVGMGGVLVELLPPPAVEMAPLTEPEAAALIRASAAGRLLAGYRRIVPPTDLAPLARLVAALSRLGSEHASHIAAIDLNPVMVRHGSGEALVVDALVLGGAP